MNIQIIKDIDTLLGCKKDWDAILQLRNNQNYYLTLDWIQRWWQFFGKTHGLYILVLTEGETVLGFVPLMSTKKGLHTEYRFVTYPRGVRAGMVIRPGSEETVASCAFQHMRAMKGGAVFYLQGFSEDSPILQALLENLSGIRYHMTTIPYYYISLRKQGRDAYFKKARKHNTIKKVFSLEKKLNTLAPLTFIQAKPDEIDPIFPMHEKRWTRKNDTNGFGKGISKEFYTFLAQEGNPMSGALATSFDTRVYLLKAGKKPIGFIYGFLCNGHFAGCRIAYELDFSTFRTGYITAKDLFEILFEQDVESFDFSTGDEDYKRLWTDEYETVCQLEFGTDSLCSQSVLRADIRREKIRATLKKSERLVRFKRVTWGRIKHVLSGVPIRKAFKKIRILSRQRKPGDYFRCAFKKLMTKIYKKSIYQFYQVTKRPPRPADMGSIDICLVTVDDLDLLSSLMPSSTSEIVSRYKNSDFCYLFSDKGKIFGIAWICQSNICLKCKTIWKNAWSNSKCLYDICTFKPFNMEKMYTALYQLISSHYIKNGRFYVLINRLDHRMLQLADRMFTPVSNTEVQDVK